MVLELNSVRRATPGAGHRLRLRMYQSMMSRNIRFVSLGNATNPATNCSSSVAIPLVFRPVEQSSLVDLESLREGP